MILPKAKHVYVIMVRNHTGESMIKSLSIEYCVPCQYEKDARNLATIIQEQFGLDAAAIELIPSKKIGTFEICADGKLIYSKTKSGKMPAPEEIINCIFLQSKG